MFDYWFFAHVNRLDKETAAQFLSTAEVLAAPHAEDTHVCAALKIVGRYFDDNMRIVILPELIIRALATDKEYSETASNLVKSVCELDRIATNCLVQTIEGRSVNDVDLTVSVPAPDRIDYSEDDYLNLDRRLDSISLLAYSRRFRQRP